MDISSLKKKQHFLPSARGRGSVSGGTGKPDACGVGESGVRKNDSRIQACHAAGNAEAGRSTASVRYEYANAALYLSSGGAGRRAFFRKYPRSSPCDGESCAASLYYPYRYQRGRE